MIFGGFSVRFGFLIGVGIKAFGWMDSWEDFFESSFVNWASFKVNSMFLNASLIINYTINVKNCIKKK